MSMTRKDYLLAVRLIKDNDNERDKGVIVEFLTSFFKTDNFRFKEEVFREACQK
jgi:hypothetical protein